MTSITRILTRACTALALVAAGGLLMLALAGTAKADGLGAGIANSPHDFSTEAWNFRGEVCRVCHVPHDHGRNTGILTEGLLWNHALSAATYTMYDAAWSSSLDGTVSSQPDGIAKMCLGCHDGTVAIDEFDSNIGTPGNIFIADFNPGFEIPRLLDGANEDLRATHPISIVYDEVADDELAAKTASMGTSGTIEDVLDKGKVQCSACHDVHDGAEAVPNTHLLRVAQTTAQGGEPSGLCLTCHTK